MSGFPIEKAKETMRLAMAGLYPQDTFNLITFAGETRILFPAPVPATPENLFRAEDFLTSRQGGGGTEMMKAIRAALAPSGEEGRIRIVCFMTDGFVGNDMEILGEIRRHADARIFSFGIGSSVNRFLLDAMAREGRGEAEYVSLREDGSKAARRFHERIRRPLLTDIRLAFGRLPVQDLHPTRIPDLFAAKPVIISGRFTGSGRGVLRLTGTQGLRSYSKSIPVDFPSVEPRHEALAALWARKRIEDLSARDWTGMQSGNPRPEVREEITRLGLDYRILTQFTSFVAVEERTVSEAGVLRRVDVPVEMPEGVSHEGVFGGAAREMAPQKMAISAAPMTSAPSGDASIGGLFLSRSAKTEQVPRQMPLEEKGKVDANEMTRLKDSAHRLHPRILQWMEEAGSGRLKGEVEVEIRLSTITPQVQNRLKQLGFRSALPMGNVLRLTGTIPVLRLKELSEMIDVLYLAPA